jgi:hypothetical protein
MSKYAEGTVQVVGRHLPHSLYSWAHSVYIAEGLIKRDALHLAARRHS